MNYEEKTELRRQISQMLADAGINQTTLREMVQDSIDKKVARTVEQVAAASMEKYLKTHIPTYRREIDRAIEEKVKEQLLGKVISINLLNNDEIIRI